MDEPFDAHQRIARYGSPGLGFDGQQCFARLHDDVHFGAMSVPIERNRRGESPVDARLADLRGDLRFEDRAAQWMVGQLLRRTNAEQEACEAGVEEVEFRRLDETLRHVRVQRRELPRDVPRIEDREPRLRRVVRDARVRTERREVHELTGAPGTEANESLKRVQVSDVEQGPYVAFQVVGDILGYQSPGVSDRSYVAG